MTRKPLGNQKLLQSNFGHRVIAGRGRPREFSFSEGKSGRWAIFACIAALFFFLFAGRLFDLQIIEGSYFRLLAEGNRIRRVPIKAPRGEIVDRNGVSLARNIPVYKLATFTSGGIVKETEEIPRDEALKIQAEGGEEATRLLIDNGREYPLKEVTAHVVGYVNEASKEEVGTLSSCHSELSGEESLANASNVSGTSPEILRYAQDDNGVYQIGDLVGRMGIEEQYDCLLRGVNGEELIEVDARGKLVRRLGRKEPIPGKTIQLSLDSNLQQVAYTSLLNAPTEKGQVREEKDGIVKGGLVAENPTNGEILALVSVPSFDPNTMRDNYAKLVQDKNLPFFNRAIGGAYNPGSTFKIITSAAALQEGAIDGNYTYNDIGYVEAGGTRFRNWLYGKNGGAEGSTDVIKALARSTDTFFYIVGDLLGIDKLAEWSHKFGIGQKTGIDLPGEAAGLMPTPDWKIQVKGERWYLGNTYNTSIGQGDVLATPLQIAQETSVIANNGKKCVPRVAQVAQEECTNLGLRDDVLQLIKQGMVGACSPGGTAGSFFTFEPRVSCKTGTAEVGNNNTHAWFTSFGPTDNPQIEVSAVVEEGGEGSVVAAPVVKKVYEKYFGKN